jgi:hypothetical protein
MDRGWPWIILQLALSAGGCAPNIVTLWDVPDSGAPDAVVLQDVQADTPSPATEVGCATKPTVLTYMQQPAQVLIEMDRSSNMQDAFSPTTRAGEVQTALTKEIVGYQQHVQFGYEQFPSSGFDGPCASGSCCAGLVTISPAINNFSDISSSINCYSDPHGGNCMSASADSPSHAALAVANDYLSSRRQWQFDGDQYVLLFTASEPSCAGQDSATACAAASKATSDLSIDGVHVNVVSVGYPPDPSGCLSHLSPTTTNLQVATSSKDLSSKVHVIIQRAASAACTFIYYQTPPADAKPQVSLGQSGSVPSDGWIFGYTHNVITLLGSSCETFLQSTMDRLSVTFSTCAD